MRPFSGFWAAHFAEALEDGSTPEEIRAETTMLYLPPETAEPVDLGELRSMPRLDELVIHSEHVLDKGALAEIPSLRALVVGSPAFGAEDLPLIA